jgi:hypothetical protein
LQVQPALQREQLLNAVYGHGGFLHWESYETHNTLTVWTDIAGGTLRG